MPRRRPTKALSYKRVRRKDGSVQKWKSREDIPFDEVDEFHEQRDKILLEGENRGPDSDLDEDEVFALNGLEGSSEEEEEEGEEGEEHETEEGPKPVPKKTTKPQMKSKKEESKGEAAGSSDDESEGEEDEESWGLRKSTYYSSNAAQIDSDDDEAREMEEQEAKRLQAKLRAPMTEEDFGYSEALENAIDLTPIDDFWNRTEKPSSVTAGKDKISILRHLQRTNPEALALAFEWEDIARQVVLTEQKLAEIPNDPEDKSLGFIHLHNQALQTYASLLAFYIHLRASQKYATRPGLLRRHPIMKRLLQLKQSLHSFENLNFAISDSEDDELNSEEDEFDDSELDSELDDFDSWLTTKKPVLEANELEDLLLQANAPTEKLPKVKLNVNKKASDEKKQQQQTQEPPRKKQRKLDGTAAPSSKVEFDVEEPTLPSKSSSSTAPKKEQSNSFGFGEATSLDEAGLVDKKGRRKALRFHTAKIESASARRQGARAALGGDDDLPYRKREKEIEELVKKYLGARGDDLDDVEPGPEEQEQRRSKHGRDDEKSGEDGEDDDDEGYYSLVKRQKKAKQAEKKAAYEAMKEANRVELEEDSVQGQRSASRAILVNKGLTPKRSKSVRNPRVKKRQKFEKAKKKLGSQKAIYKGGIGDPNSYGGEMSGISKVVKSVKL